ncbi:unnamed protein product [Rotaria sp. Silwood1]|nr:unnamed protein product [Rotaria sp. Silwood1]CAF4707715.1 unnamed protein product [Rotaria sp. Silwood1]CAF4924342.1 unnamed protein product [Rotaria sp. Silwood1]CAF4951992.1 unnamed protein product [Rotaria sp. Silwood1]
MMVNNNIKRLLKRVGITEKKIIRRQYNRTYYEGTKQQRREHYRKMKEISERETNIITILPITEHAAATRTTVSNNYEHFFETTDDYPEIDNRDCEGKDSIDYDYENKQQTQVNIDEPSVFCYDTDSSSDDELDGDFDDDEHNGENWDRELNEVKLKLSSRKYSKIDMATCLCLLKKRHKCSNALLVDFISLLYIIIPDAEEKIPKSLFEIRKLLKIIDDKKQSTSSMSLFSPSHTITICQSCETIVQSIDKCSNIECSERAGFKLKPYTYTYFNIRRQIEQILQRETKITFPKTSSLSTTPSPLPSSILTDIKDGRIYHDFLSKINIILPDCHCITLTLSTDGVQIGKSTEKSLWLITLTINEIQISERFSLHNVIICGINNCFKKPSRQIMRIMIDPIVKELKELENPKCCYIKSLNNKFQLYCVHLLGSTNDKPATALLQNIAEPTAAYGCSRCEIKGKTTLSNPRISEKKTTAQATTSNQRKTCKETHRIRVFVTEEDQRIPALRSNERYQIIMRIIQNQQPTPGTDEEQDIRRGYLGPCLLTDLTFFDQGRGFLSDSLHTLYGGAMKKLLSLWFDRKWCTKEKPWTIESKISNINRTLKSFYSPSTTVRIPRDLKVYSKYKASEYRSMLLVFYPIFQDILPKEYYNHLKLLVFALHIGENREIENKDLETMHLLLNEHVKQFKFLYGERHCVNTIHSTVHFVDTVRDYGPLQCYSTFNYESILGAMTSTIHGCRKQDKEIFNNMEMLRQSSFIALEESQESLLYEYMLKLTRKGRRKPFIPGEFTTTKPIQLEQEERNNLQKIYSTETLQAYSRCEYENLKYSSYYWKQSRFDTAILFRKKNTDKLKFALIDKFIVCEQSQRQLFIQVHELEDEYFDSVIINDITVKNLNTAIGQINFTSTKQILPTQIVEKVFCLHRKEKFFFIRLPNETESS